jgi:hypothetical protein
MWPSLKYDKAFGPEGLNLPAPATLQGDQCLVFFLGGRQDSKVCYGFSMSKTNPFETDLAADREQPLFKFKSSRMVLRVPGSTFHSYLDGYAFTMHDGAERSSFYAYFAPNRKGIYDPSHCSGLADRAGVAPRPYKDANGQYLNRGSYQLLSAGKDLLWGTGTQWSPSNGTGESHSMDNLSNFANGIMAGS